MNIPSQSQSSPIIHFTNPIRQCSSPSNPLSVSPSNSIDYNSQEQFEALILRPQSTPISSPIFLSRLSTNNYDKPSTNENFLRISKRNKKRRITTFDYSSLTNVSPLNEINNRIKSPILFEISDEEEQEKDRYYLRPPPLMVLSQSIQAKHPEQLNQTKLNNRFSSIKDLPNSPANYSFVFVGFTQTQIEEAKRLTRRMGDCFTNEMIDLTTTHIILPNDDPHLTITLDLILALIYGCRLVTIEWLKCSSRIGEWLGVDKFEPKNVFHANPSLNIYRKFRQEKQSIELFKECGLIYLTSLITQRSLLLKLISLLGGNITVNRDRAKMIVGQSSKILQIIIHPQVNEQWVIGNVFSCFLSFIFHICATLFATAIIIISFLTLIGQIGSVCSTSSTSNTYFLSINISLIAIAVFLKIFFYAEMILLYFLQRHTNDSSILSDKEFPAKYNQIIADDTHLKPWTHPFRSINDKNQHNIKDLVV